MPASITAALPSTRAMVHLTDSQLGSIVQALDTNHDGQLTNDEVHLSFSARGRMQDDGTTTAAVAIALRDEKVAIRQLPSAVASQVAGMVTAQLWGMAGFPAALDTDHNGSISQSELATALSKGQVMVNRSIRTSYGAPYQEEHFAVTPSIPVADIAQSQDRSQYFLIRGDGSSALAAAVAGLRSVAAAGGEQGLAAAAIYQGLGALKDMPQYYAQPGWLAMIGRFGLAAIGRGESSAQSILASAGRQVLYERPDEDGAREFYTAALKTVQSQLPANDNRWDSVLLKQLENEPSALALLRSAFAGGYRAVDPAVPSAGRAIHH